MTDKKSLFGGLDAGPTIAELKLSDVSPDPEQPRKTFEEGALKELADSIAQHGQISPIVVRKDPASAGKFLITAGERRYRAIGINKGETIQAIVRDGENAQVIAVIENLQRVDLSPIEEAEAVARLMVEQDLSQVKVSKLIGKSRTRINQLLRINELPEQIRVTATESGVAKSILIELAQLTDEKLQLKLWDKALAGNLTIPEIRKAKKTGTASGKSAKAPTSSEKALSQLDRAVGAVQALKKLDDAERQRVRDAINRLDGITVISPDKK